MTTGDYQELIDQLKHLTAENESLRQLLQQGQINAGNQQPQQAAMPAAESSVKALASKLENKSIEIESLRYYIGELREKAEAAVQREQDVERELTRSASTVIELENVRSKYHHLQAQLDDLSETLRQLHQQQIIQQQHAGRVAELESLLAMAEEEIELLKKHPAS